VQFRILAVVLPRDYRTLWLDVEMHVDGRLRGLDDKIQDAITKAPPDQRAQLNQLFADYRNQLTAAEAQMDAAQNEIPALDGDKLQHEPHQL